MQAYRRTWKAALVVLAISRICSAQIDLDDPAEPWKTAKAGMDTEVPPPFEALRRDGTAVSCWGRSYRMTGLFPETVSSAGSELLAAPIAVSIRLPGADAERLDPGEPRFPVDRDDRIEWEGRGSAAEISWTSRGWIEFDGVMQLRLTLRSPTMVKVDALAVEIPLVPSVDLYHAHTCWKKYLNGEITREEGVKLESDWLACWWLGDDRRGLTFVSETAAGWTGTGKAFRIVREKERLVLRAGIWNEPTEFEGERTFVFGLQATPTKPLPPTWHGRHVGKAVLEHVNISVIWFGAEKWFSYPQEEKPGGITTLVERQREDGRRVTLYITPSGTGPESEVQKRNHDDWLLDDGAGKPVLFSSGVEGKKKGLSGVCPASSYTDWMAWAIDQAMAQYDIDGIYVDNAAPYPCRNTRHGCGGEGQATYPYFASRAWHKRLYKVIRRHKPVDGLVWEHTSRMSNSFALSFVDIYSDGEQFRNPEYDPNAINLDQIDRAFMRVGFSGRQWGAQPCFLPSLIDSRIQYTDWILARTLPYGNVLWAEYYWMDSSRETPVLRARHEFGLGREQVEWFTPSDDRPEWLAVAPDHLLVGGYIRGDGEALVTISDITGESAVASIPLAPLETEFGQEPLIWDPLVNMPVTWKRKVGRVNIMVPANSFRVLRFGKGRPE